MRFSRDVFVAQWPDGIPKRLEILEGEHRLMAATISMLHKRLKKLENPTPRKKA